MEVQTHANKTGLFSLNFSSGSRNGDCLVQPPSLHPAGFLGSLGYLELDSQIPEYVYVCLFISKRHKMLCVCPASPPQQQRAGQRIEILP